MFQNLPSLKRWRYVRGIQYMYISKTKYINQEKLDERFFWEGGGGGGSASVRVRVRERCYKSTNNTHVKNFFCKDLLIRNYFCTIKFLENL